MTDQTTHFAIQFDSGLYYIGYNNVDVQLRKAKLYNSPKYAEAAATDYMKRCNKSSNPVNHIKYYRLVTVEFSILSTTEWRDSNNVFNSAVVE